jgi:hypothetical protein
MLLVRYIRVIAISKWRDKKIINIAASEIHQWFEKVTNIRTVALTMQWSTFVTTVNQHFHTFLWKINLEVKLDLVGLKA